jgi:hypothetical protein
MESRRFLSSGRANDIQEQEKVRRQFLGAGQGAFVAILGLGELCSSSRGGLVSWSFNLSISRFIIPRSYVRKLKTSGGCEKLRRL